MADLRSTYMGIALKNPLIAGASSLTSNMDTIRKLEDSGAAALVISSLFEETIQLQSYKMEQDMSYFDNLDAEIGQIFPDIEHSGPEEHLTAGVHGIETGIRLGHGPPSAIPRSRAAASASPDSHTSAAS